MNKSFPLIQPGLGRAIRELRESRGLTLTQTAKLLGTQPGDLGAIEIGKGNSTISRTRLAKLLDLLGYELQAVEAPKE